MTSAKLMTREERDALSKALRYLRNAQGFALNAAAIFIEVTTAETDEARADVATQFRTFRDLYGKTIKDATRAPELRAQSPKAEALIKTALEVHARFKALDDERDFADISAAEAGRLVNFVRLKGVPSIMELIGTLSSTKKAHDTAVQGVMRERLVKLDKMFTEVEDIGRMIHLISLNASVEAARAGGESGRSFKVIADEIRGLAQQASVLIDTTREGVLPGSDSDPLALNLR
ncbi:MAG: methyl-accepting chemotaxis protein [Pseudomonadota bacterium]